jgi:thymidine kinase
MAGRLELIMGCMFSGKSTEMIRRLKRYKAINKKILVINSSKDVRNPKAVLQTHDNITFDCVKTDNLLTLFCTDEIQTADIIAIDEAQFFSQLRDFVERVLEMNKHIIVAGLDGDYKQCIFGDILYLIPLADEVDKLKAMCMKCNNGTLGPFTKRIIDNTEQELIGANEMYKSVCRLHLKN